jgi:hypothetical protein
MRMRTRYVVAALACTALGTLAAQRWYNPNLKDSDFKTEQNPRYDGRFTFLRLRYAGLGGLTNEGPGWMHDYPEAERHLMTIMHELSTLDSRSDSSAVLNFDDPEIFKYPVAYLSEPGHWQPTEKDVVNLRKYLLKGGFLIVDDFQGGHWFNWEQQIRRVLPEGKLMPLDLSNPAFDSFYRIASLDMMYEYGRGQQKSEFWGIYEDNDPKKRLMLVANYNNDIGDYWQWSSEGLLPIPLTNEAYKFGVNYLIYGLTH